MSALIEAKRYWCPSLGETISDATDHIKDNFIDVVNSEIDFRVEDYTVVNTTTEGNGDNFIVLKPNSSTTLLAGNDNLLYFELDGIIDDWVVGDLINISTPSVNTGSYTITELIDANTIRLDTSFTQEILPVNTIVANITPIQGIEFKSNLIENLSSPGFESLTDGSEIRAIVQGVDSTDTTTIHTMTQLGNKSHQYGSITIKGNDSGLALNTTVAQGFTISQPLLISPIFLSDQIEDIKNQIAPDYFLNSNCLKHVFEIEASEDASDPNKKKQGIAGEAKGNSGWLNENYNTGITNYSISDLLYKKGLTVNSALELTTDDTTLEFLINNTTDTPFSTGNTKMVFSFSYLPQPETEYRDVIEATSQDLKTNYLFDRVEGTLGSLSTTPDNLGTDIQMIKEVNFVYLTSSLARVVVTFSMAPAAVDRIANLSERDYLVVLSTQNHTNTSRDAASDKVALRVDVDEMFIDTTDPTLITLTNTFLAHDGSIIGTDDTSTIQARKEDDIVGICKFTLDNNGREADDIFITSAIAQVIASNGTDEFVLDEENRSLTGFDRVNGITFIDNIVADRGFKTPADENRGSIKLFSDTALDSAGIFNYQFQFPFILRWEDWEPLESGADDDFHNTSQDNNGINHDWHHYDTLAGWDIYFKVTINATKNGSPQTYTESSIINTHNYLDGLEWDTENLEYSDFISGDVLPQLIQKYANTKVSGNKTYIGTIDPVLADLVIVLKINVFEKGNYKAQYTLSSAYDAHINTWWLSTDTSNRVVIDVSANPIFKGVALLNADLLPTDETTFKLTCRFYDKRPEVLFPLGNGKLLEDGSYKQIEASGFKLKD